MMKNPDQTNVKQASVFCGERKETKGTDCFWIWSPEKRNLIFFISFFVLFLFSLLVSDTFSSLLFLFFLLFLLSFCSHSFLSRKCFLTAEEWPVYTDSIELSHPQTSGTIFLYFGLFKSPLGSNEPICRL